MIIVKCHEANAHLSEVESAVLCGNSGKHLHFLLYGRLAGSHRKERLLKQFVKFPAEHFSASLPQP